MSKHGQPFTKCLDIILPPPLDHVPGTIPRRWVSRKELEQTRQHEEFELYLKFLERVNYDAEGLRANKHFANAYNNTRKFLRGERS